MAATGTDTQGDLGRLFEEESARLWRAVFVSCRDRTVADDAVAEAFAQCLRRGEAVREPRAWVWRTAFAIARGLLRDRGRDLPLSDVTAVYEMPEPLHRLADALALLSTNQRTAVVLRHYAGFGTDEIAEILGSSRATVRVHLARARRRLRRLLEASDD